MPLITTILHPTDLPETSQAAFRLAYAMVGDYGAELVVLRVYPPPSNRAEAVDRGRDNDVEDALLEKLRELTPDDMTVPVDYQVAEGNPAEVIVDAARMCDLIVTWKHGRCLLRRAIPGTWPRK